MKIVALTALADLLGLPSLFFTLLIVSIAEDFGVAVLLARHSLRVLFFFIVLKVRSWPTSGCRLGFQRMKSRPEPEISPIWKRSDDSYVRAGPDNMFPISCNIDL